MGRSSARGRRPRAAAPLGTALAAEASAPAAAALASAMRARTGGGLTYRPLDDVARVQALFDYAALPWPGGDGRLLGWGAFQPAPDGEALVGAVVAEASARAALIHGPVVVAERDALQVAAELVGTILDHAVAAGAATIFARPQGLDRIWVRFGFIPVPEGALPEGLSRRLGDGLYAWRGGSAIWSLRRVDSA